jgi:ketosteroid isomerase-like protein
MIPSVCRWAKLKFRSGPNQNTEINRKKLLFDDIAYLNENYVIENVEISGDLAVAHVIWSAMATLKKSGESVNPKGNWIWVFKRKTNMTWELFYSIWSNEDLIFPSEVE